MSSRRPRSTPTKATPAPPEAPQDSSSNSRAASPIFLPPEDLPAELMPPAPMTDSSPPPLSSPPSVSDVGPVVGSPSDTPSTDKPAKLGRASIRGFAKKAIVAAGKYAQARLTAPNSPERMEGMWMPDDEDVKDIAEPVAGLVVRRIPQRAGGVIANPDVEDGLVLLFAVAAYIGKQIERRDRIRQLYTQVTPDLTADDVEPVPA